MSKFQLEVLLGVIAYLSFGIGYTLKEYGGPETIVEEVREEAPEFDTADQVAPAFVRAVIAFVWVVMMLIWPWYLARDVYTWIWDHTLRHLYNRTFGRFVKSMADEIRADQESEKKEEDS